MNEKVADLGLQDTHFVNPSGMDAAGHYSSAYDMAMLGRVAMRNEAFRQLAGAATYRGDGYSMANLNRLLGAYPGADGVKIGFTRAAGRTIVASATHDGHRVYVSLMRSQDLPGDSGASSTGSGARSPGSALSVELKTDGAGDELDRRKRVVVELEG